MNPAQAAPVQAAPAKQPSWWQRLLPTAGGVVGGILGSLVPVPGLDIAAGAGGAAAGGALGKEIENKLTGQTGGVGTSAVENAIGGGVGGVLGKLGVGTARLLSSGAETGATKLMAGQVGNILPKESIEDLFSNYGINKLTANGDAGQIAKFVTGSSKSGAGLAEFNKAVESGIINNGPQSIHIGDLAPDTMNLGQVEKPVKQLAGFIGNKSSALDMELPQGPDTLQQLINRSSIPTDYNETNIKNQIAGDLRGAMSKGVLTDGAGAANISTENGVKLMRNWYKAAYDYMDQAAKSGAGTTRDIAQAKASVFSQLGDELKGRLGLSETAIPAEEKNALISKITQHASPINDKAATQLIQDVQDSTTYGDLASKEAKWVNVSKALGKTAQKEASMWGTSPTEMLRGALPITGAISGGKSGAVLGAAGALMKNRTASGAGSTLLGGLSKMTGSQTAKKLIPMLTTMGAVSAANLPNDIPPPANNVNMGTGGQPAQPQGAMPMNPVTSELSQMTGMMGIDPYLTSALAGPVGQLAPLAQKYSVAQNLLGNLGGAFQGAGGAQGGGQGLLTQLSGMLPFTAAHAYNQQVQAVASQLSSLLGISPQAAMGLAPNFMQTPQVAQQRLGGLTELLGGGSPSLLGGLQ